MNFLSKLFKREWNGRYPIISDTHHLILCENRQHCARKECEFKEGRFVPILDLKPSYRESELGRPIRVMCRSFIGYKE